MAAVLDIPWNGQSFTPPTALDIATIETALVTQLRSQITTIEVVHFPDRPESYRMTHPIGAALVAFRGATYGTSIATASIVQKRKLEFEVRVMTRDLGWAYGGPKTGTGPGAYTLLEAIRVALTGFAIPGCNKAYPATERFVERDNQGGVWIYAISFIVETLAVEASTEPAYPLFVKGVALETAGVTRIAVAAALATFDQNGTITLAHGNVSDVIVTAVDGTPYVANTDYLLDSVNGIITIAPGGALSAGATVELAYSYAETAVATTGQSSPLNQS